MNTVTRALRRYYEFLSWSVGNQGEGAVMAYFFTVAITLVFMFRYEEVFTQPLDWGIFIIYILSVCVIALHHYTFFWKKKSV